MGKFEHIKSAPSKLSIGIITVSSTRTLEKDKSGQWMKKLAKKEGHDVVHHQVIGDDFEWITQTVTEITANMMPHILILTGGTGLSPADVTIEAVRPMFSKELTAFAALFAQLSFEEIDSAAILSRATAGVIHKTIVFCLPGSINACKLACKALIFPEATHLVAHVRIN